MTYVGPNTLYNLSLKFSLFLIPHSQFLIKKGRIPINAAPYEKMNKDLSSKVKVQNSFLGQPFFRL